MSQELEAPRKRGRPRKLPLAEVEAKLLEVGLELLINEGLFSGLNALKLDWAIAYTRVPRTTAYNLFKNGENFRRCVLLHAVKSIPSGKGLSATAELSNQILAECEDDLNSEDPDRIEAVRSRLLRETAACNFDLLNGSAQWQLFRAVMLTMQTDPDDEEFNTVIEQAETNLVELYAAYFEDLAKRVHLKRKKGVTANEFAMAAYALNDGLANRATQSFRRHGYKHKSENWSLLAIGLEALIYRFYERQK